MTLGDVTAKDLPDPQTMIARRAALLGPAYRLFYDRPLHLVRGAGVWLFDPQGNAYLDAYNNVACVGHSHPRVVSAIAEQAGTLATHTRYLHEAPLTYAERLLATLPGSIDRMMFTCTGSEANDLAFRIAKMTTGGTGVVVTQTAYHGVTDAVAAFSPSLCLPDGMPPHVRAVPAPCAYRGEGDSAARFAGDVSAAFDDLQRCGVKPAMFICDSIFSSDGILDGPAGLIAPAVAQARAAGALYVADEVQSGFGRTGDGMWGFQRHQVQPDIVTMGKPMGNGYPVAGLAARADLIDTFGRNVRYFNTFGGNAVALVAATAVLDVLEDERLIEHARDTGQYLKNRLCEVMVRQSVIGDVRGAGLFIGMEIVKDWRDKTADPTLAAVIVNAMRDRRVLISASGTAGNVLKIRPPLVFSKPDADLLANTLIDVLGDLD